VVWVEGASPKCLGGNKPLPQREATGAGPGEARPVGQKPTVYRVPPSFQPPHGEGGNQRVWLDFSLGCSERRSWPHRPDPPFLDFPGSDEQARRSETHPSEPLGLR
jgi:hypothetical protein